MAPATVAVAPTYSPLLFSGWRFFEMQEVDSRGGNAWLE